MSQSLKAAIIFVPASYTTIGEAITAANSGDLIIVSPGTYTETGFVIDKDIAIRGSWTGKVTIDADGVVGSMFRINNGTLTLSWLTLTGNNGSSWYHNVICNLGGNVTIFNCLITGNTGAYGTAIFQDDDASVLNITNTTISGNTSVTGVAGLKISKGTANLMNVTITANNGQASNAIVGLSIATGTTTITNSIIYGNTGGSVQNIRLFNAATLNLGSDVNIFGDASLSGTVNGTYLVSGRK